MRRLPFIKMGDCFKLSAIKCKEAVRDGAASFFMKTFKQRIATLR